MIRNNPDTHTSKQLLDKNQREVNQLYEIAETSGNWEQVAEFELNLILEAIDRTPKAKL